MDMKEKNKQCQLRSVNNVETYLSCKDNAPAAEVNVYKDKIR